MTSEQPTTGKSIRKGSLILALVALAFYLGFILLGVLQS